MDAIGISILASFCGIVLSVALTYLANKANKSDEKKDTRLDTLWEAHHEKKHDSEMIGTLVKKIDALTLSNSSLDSHVRHEIANMRTSVNGFGERLSFIEEEAKNRDKLGNELKGKVELLERFILNQKN